MTPRIPLEYARSRKGSDRHRTWSGWLFVSCWGIGAASIGSLWAGFGMYGAGHGNTAAADKVWISGLALSVIAGCALLASIIEGMISWIKSGRPVWRIFPGAVLLILLPVVGVWALTG